MSSISALTFRERLDALLVRIAARMPARVQLWLSGEPRVVLEGQRLDPMLQLVRTLMRRRNFALAAPDLRAARARFEREQQVYAGSKTDVWGVRDLTVDGAVGPLRARHYAPPDWGTEGAIESETDSGPKPLLVYFHGGGFALGSVETHDECCRLLCASGELHVLSVEYRLTPEHPFPAALDDARAALHWAQAHTAELGADPERVAVGGDDAGGNLAAAVAQLETAAGTPPIAQLLIYPMVDAAGTHPSHALYGDGFFLDARDRAAFTAAYTAGGGFDDADPRVSPLRALSVDGLPAALVVTAGFDILRDEGREYSTRLLDAGVRVMTLHYPALGHGFVNMVGVSPAARDATVHVGAGFRMLIEGARSSGPRPVNL